MAKVPLYAIFGVLALVILAGPWSATANSSAATCHLTKITISGGALAANTEKVTITATPLCWSGSVEVNRGNADVHVITVQVIHGIGAGVVPRLEKSSPCDV